MSSKLRTLLSFILSYIVIALIPTIVYFMYFYPKAKESIINEEITATFVSAKHTMSNIDNQMKPIYNIPNYISQNKQITQLSIENNEITRLNAISEMKYLISGNSLIIDIFIYLRNKEYFISGYSSTMSLQNLKLYQGKYGFYYDDWNFDDMLETLNSVNMLIERSAEPIIVKGLAISDVITLIQSNPPNNRYAYATTMVFISGEELQNLMVNIYDPETSFAIFNAKHIKIHSSPNTSNNWEEQIEPIIFSKPEGSDILTISDEKHIIAWCTSEFSNWKYVVTVPFQAVFSEIQVLQKNVLFLIIALSALLGLIITLSMHFNYSPLGKLALSINQNAFKSANKSEKLNQFQEIKKNIEMMQKNNRELFAQLDAAKPLLKEKALRKLLTLKPSKNYSLQDMNEFSSAGINLSMKSYQVIIIQFNKPEMFSDAINELTEKKSSVIKSFMQTSSQNTIILLLGEFKYLDNLANKFLEDKIYERLDIMNSWLGFGSCVHSLEEVSCSYSEAYISLDYAKIKDKKGQILNNEAYLNQSLDCNTYPISDIQTLMFGILQQDIKLIIESIHKISTILQSGKLPPYFLRAIFYNSTSLLLDGLTKLISSIDDTENKLQNLNYHVLSMQHSSAEMISILFDFVELYKNILNNDYYSNSTQIEIALHFINNNISNSTLSLTDVADYCKMSPTYFSHFFKEKTGHNFKEHVDSLRLEISKEMLNDGILKISKIASEVGYINTYSFSRFFKRKMGITPIDYREMIRRQLKQKN